jgi:23S rRNA pseudouridine1911/1915/1917 synthase
MPHHNDPIVPVNAPGNAPGLTVTQRTELLAFLLAQLPQQSRNSVKKLLKYQQVMVDGKVETQFNHPLLPQQQVTIRGHQVKTATPHQGFRILHEDQDLIVVDKQAGILSIATTAEKQKTVYHQLSDHVKRQHPANKIFVVHRLDRDTSGVMMFAKNEPTQKLLRSSWDTTVMERIYAAVVEGVVEKPAGVITSYLKENRAFMVYSSPDPVGGKKAVTRYQVLRQNHRFALLRVELETGRKNQIRVHMHDIGHSVIGDEKYGSTVDPIGRLGLHAQLLAFAHPTSGRELRFESAIPGKFMGLF